MPPIVSLLVTYHHDYIQLRKKVSIRKLLKFREGFYGQPIQNVYNFCEKKKATSPKRYKKKLRTSKVVRAYCYRHANLDEFHRGKKTNLKTQDLGTMKHPLIFRQLIEFASSTYTYILGCSATRKAVIIDPVLETVHRDAEIIRDLDLDLVYGLNTHVHADHVTGTGVLKTAFPTMKSVLAANSGGKADHYVKEGDKIKFGHEHLDVLATPGHTDGCLSYVSQAHRMVFTGDALLIRACGRTDFQQGNARTLYRSIWDKLFTLPDDFTVYVGHNYDGILQTSIAEEKKYNPRLTKSEEEFVNIMSNLNLPYPKQIDRALPANMKDGQI
ncbi:hypothetical protein RB195_001030 [Necator americanus]|uniref:Metallo-beta-lactamase domain-containing protein n=1 Tax=Necator americanus TaxID=51031 RepID=A0ABR1DCD6_NECAM